MILFFEFSLRIRLVTEIYFQMKYILCFLTLVVSISCTNNNNNNSDTKFTNPNCAIDERVNDLLSRMTIEEKVAQMRMFHENRGIETDENGNMVLSDNVIYRLQHGIGGIKNPGEHISPENAARLNNQLQAYIIENSRLGIPAFFVTESYNGVDAAGCTRFARPINMASTWNLELVEKAYDQIGREARARGLHLTHSPVADIVRDPRFGRMSEAFSEDTYLATEMVVRAVRGMQGNFEGLNSTHIGAVTKHFAGYAQVAGGLNFASIEISPRTFIDEILPPFKAAVQRASTLGIMPAHGDINGVACHASTWLLTELLRNEWGFEGYVVSDSNDVPRLFYFMKVAETPEDAVVLGLTAGVDIDLYADDGYALLPEMVKEMPHLEKYIDRATARVLRTKFILGLFDNPYVDELAVNHITRHGEAMSLAHNIDLESITLLKNDHKVLPLLPANKPTIALVGPLLGDKTKEYFDEIAGDKAVFFEEKGFSLTDGSSGAPRLSDPNENFKGIKKIIDLANRSDMVFLFVGGDEFTAKEAFFNHALGDRDDVDPVGEQNLLMLELKKLNKPVVVVLKHRRTLSINTFHEHADAILGCWELSEFGDKAIAGIIFGDAVPSGKLPVTVPRSIGQIPIHYSQKEINYKKQYLFTESTPLYPFGFGLSYTEFDYSNPQITDQFVKKNNIVLDISVDVTNIGDRPGKEVVQLYIKDVIGSVLRPDKELKGFQKIELRPGEKQTVTFSITPEMLEFTGLDMEKVIETGEFIAMIGTSSAEYVSIPFQLID